MENIIENMINEFGIFEVEAILNKMKSKINIQEELKKDIILLLTDSIIFIDKNKDDVDYRKNNKLICYYNIKDNHFFICNSVLTNLTSKYNLNTKELNLLLNPIVEEILNYKNVRVL